MAEALFLNKIQIDLPFKPITRKIRIGDVGDVESLKSSFSYTVQIPRTSRNMKVFDMLGIVGNTSRKPYETISCDYWVDGFYLVQNGGAIIKSTGGFFSLNIIDGIKSLSDILENKTINELDLSSLNHTLTAQTLVDSFSNTSGYIYGVANFGKGTDIETISALEVLDIVSTTDSHSVPLTVSVNETGGGAIDVSSSSGVTSMVNSFYIVVTDSGSIDFDVFAVIDLLFGVDSSQAALVLKQYRSGSLHDSQTVQTVSGNNGDTGAINVNSSFTFSDVDIADYFILSVEVVTGGFQTTSQYIATVDVSAYTYFKAEKQIPSIFLHTLIDEIFVQNGMTYEGDFLTDVKFLKEVVTLSKGYVIDSVGESIAISDNLSEFSQIDLIKDIVNRYGLLMIPEVDNHFKFVSIEEVLTGTSSAEDWTQKLDKIVSEDYNSGYAKKNTAKFNYTDDTIFENYNGEFLIDDKNASNQKELFNSPYEIPILATRDLLLKDVYSVPLWEINDDGVRNAESAIKVMTIEQQNIDIDVKMLEDSTIVNQSGNVPFLSLTDISLQDSIDNNYTAFIDMLEDYVKIKASVILNPIDVYNLDFTKLKYLKQTGRFYYLNSVQYTPNRKATVELIKI